MNGRDRGELMWSLLRSFFVSRKKFLEIFDRYEKSVLRFAQDLKTARSRLKLPADEVLKLLDLQSLEVLRDGPVASLKQTAHALFRAENETDRLDHYISNIYHELSILKEEHYTLKEEHLRHDQREYDRFFREIAEYYPKRLRHIRKLYSLSLDRLLDLLPDMAEERIMVRSIYLFGEKLLSGSFPVGVVGLYRRMYPGGEAEGYAAAGRSLLESGFLAEARESLARAALALSQRRAPRNAARFRREVKEEIVRLESELAAREKALPEGSRA